MRSALAVVITIGLSSQGTTHAQRLPVATSEGAPERESPDQLRARAEWFLQGRAGADGLIPRNARNRALAELAENLKTGRLKAQPLGITVDSWAPIGPSPLAEGTRRFSGRVTSLALVPGSPGVAYAGGAQGGVWKTTDSGATWSPLTDSQPSLAIGAIAVDPNDPSVVYAGTGESNQACDSYFGAGILRSADGGASWTLLGASSFAGTSISRIAVDPSEPPTTLWAANTSGVAGFTCSSGSGTYGVWKSTNSGVSWTLMRGGKASDLVLDPLSPSVVYAGFHDDGIYKSTNGGASWSKLAGGLPAANVGVVDLAIKPGQSSILYTAIEAASNGRYLGGWKSVNAGATWTPLPTPSGTCHLFTFDDPCTYAGSTEGSCWYNLVIEADADGKVWLGGNALFRSSDEGATWADVCPLSLHVDQHAIVAAGGGVAWVGNDGGVFRTDNDGATWVNLNETLAITQFYPGASLHPNDEDRALGGAQDNGTLSYSGGAMWEQVVGGDGGFTAIDWTDPDGTLYASFQRLNIRKSTTGGQSWSSAITGLTDADTSTAPFIAPYTMCPSNPGVLVAGTDNVWRTNDAAASWGSNSPDPLGGASARIRAIAFAPTDVTCGTYFVGLDTGRVHRTLTGGGPGGWVDVSGSLPSRPINDFAVDPGNGGVVYVGLGGFGGPHLYRSINALSGLPAWTAIGAGIPDAPINAVLLDPDTPSTVYVGTDIGVFRSTDMGASWAPFMSGHPNVAVFDLVADASTGTIVSFTHGRSAFRTPACSAPQFGGVSGAEDADADAVSGVRVRWTVPASWGVDGGGGTYAIRRYTTPDCSGAAVVLDATVPGTTTTYVDATAAIGTVYYYEVVATNGCAFPQSSSGATTCSNGAADFPDSAPTSPSYRIARSTVSVAGTPATSATYRLDATAGQETVVEASSSESYVLQSGYWSFTGSPVVPLVLLLAKIPAAPGDVALTWSGNAAPYTIYRSADCSTISTGEIAVEGSLHYTDASPPVMPLLCYRVLPSVP